MKSRGNIWHTTFVKSVVCYTHKCDFEKMEVLSYDDTSNFSKGEC